ncbi:MAG TPA: carboxymuconolactone decarboxylase family protein [Pseudomonadales bacterium]
MSRLEKKRRDELSAEQREQFDRIARFRSPDADDQLGGPFDPWICSPELARRAVGFGNFIWERTTLDRRLIELAIVVTARHFRSNVEWVAHARMAMDHGVAQRTIDDVFACRRPQGAPADEQLVYDVTTALHETHDLPLDLYRKAVQAFGERGLVELIAAIGFYGFVSLTLNAFNVPVAEGGDTPFPRDDP